MALEPTDVLYTPPVTGTEGTLSWNKGSSATYTKWTIRDEGQPISSGVTIYDSTGITCSVQTKPNTNQIVYGISEDINHNPVGSPVEENVPKEPDPNP